MTSFISCVGSVNVDLMFRVDRLPDQHEKIRANEVTVCGGGSASNTAVWLSRQGIAVRMFGWVGTDIFGTLAINDLRSNGVDVRGIKVISARTPVSVCFTLPDDKRIVTSPKNDGSWAPDGVLEFSDNPRWCHTTVWRQLSHCLAERPPRWSGHGTHYEAGGRQKR